MWGVAAEAVVFARPRAAMADVVAQLTLPIIVHVRAQRALTVPHTVSARVFTHVVTAAEAGRRLWARAGLT